MAHILTFTRGNTQFVTNSGSNYVLEYVPQSPDLSTVDTNSILSDGGERPLTTRRNVTETIRFMASASSASLIQEAKYHLQRMFMGTEHYQAVGSGSPAYVWFAPNGTTGSYRSEILSGKIEVFDRSLDWRWNQKKVEFLIAYTRRYYWEGDETTLVLSNPHGSGASLQIYNQNTSNWANSTCIAASLVTGEIPTPPKIQIINSAGSSMQPHFIHVSHDLVYGPGGYGAATPKNWMDTFLEGEAASAVYAAGSSLTGSDYSGSAAQQFLIPSGSTSQTRVVSWVIPGSAVLHAAYGGHFNMLLCLATNITGTVGASTYLQGKLVYPWNLPSAVLEEGPEIQVHPNTDGGTTSERLQSLGTFRLPPILSLSGSYSDIGFSLYSRSSASVRLPIDFVQITPVDTGYRKVSMVGYNTWNSGAIVLDETKKLAYFTSSSTADTNVVPVFTITGKQINLVPNEDQRLHFLISDDTIFYVNRTVKIQVKFRPRRLTI